MQELVRQDVRQNRRGGAIREHGNHQDTSQTKSVTIQARVEESVKRQLDQYAQFIDSTPSYVITEALKVIFKRDDEFKAWLDQHDSKNKNMHPQTELDPENTRESRAAQLGT
jgi:predicted ATPase with chaperone activity